MPKAKRKKSDPSVDTMPKVKPNKSEASVDAIINAVPPMAKGNKKQEKAPDSNVRESAEPQDVIKNNKNVSCLVKDPAKKRKHTKDCGDTSPDQSDTTRDGKGNDAVDLKRPRKSAKNTSEQSQAEAKQTKAIGAKVCNPTEPKLRRQQKKGSDRVKKKSKTKIALLLGQQILVTLKQYHRCDMKDASYADITKHCGRDKDDTAWIAAFQELKEAASILPSSDENDIKQTNYEITKEGMALISNGQDMDPKLNSEEYEAWMKSALAFPRSDEIFDCLKQHGSLHRKDVAAKVGIHDGSHNFHYAFKELREFGLIELAPESTGRCKVWRLSAKAFLRPHKITENSTKRNNDETLNTESRRSKSKERKRTSEGDEMTQDHEDPASVGKRVTKESHAEDDNDELQPDVSKEDGPAPVDANQEECHEESKGESSEVTSTSRSAPKKHLEEEDTVQRGPASINVERAGLDTAEAENGKQESDPLRQVNFSAMLVEDSGAEKTPKSQQHRELEDGEIYEECLEMMAFSGWEFMEYE
jgi:hypothetical protein